MVQEYGLRMLMIREVHDHAKHDYDDLRRAMLSAGAGTDTLLVARALFPDFFDTPDTETEQMTERVPSADEIEGLDAWVNRSEQSATGAELGEWM